MYSDFRDQNGNSVAASVVLEAIKKPIIKTAVRFEIYFQAAFTPLLFVEEKDIIRGSLIVSNSCASDGIKLGSVNIGMLKVTIKNEKIAYIREPSAFIDCHFSPGYEIEIDENTKVTVMGGEYWIKEVEQLTEGVRFTCYDSMCKLDEPFTLGTITGTPYQILTQATTACGVPLKSTQAEIEALPNGTRTFTLHSDNDCKTWRDVLSYLSMLMGCFVTFARYTYGVVALPGLVVRPFGNGKESFCDTVTDVHRYKGAKFSIFDTAYAALKLKAIVTDGDGTTKADFTYTDNTIATTGQAIDLGYNPFLQADTPESDLTQTQKDILHDLLVQVAKYQYTPMQISLPVGFIYDLGDVIKCTGGLANTGFAGGPKGDAYCCILGYTYTYGKEFRIKTTGNSASITGAQSSSGAGIAPGLVNGGGSGGGLTDLLMVSYTNEDAYTIEGTETKIIELRFTSSLTWALFHAEIHAVGEGVANFRYVLNGNTIAFNPVETLGAGAHIINLFTPLTPSSGENTLKVYMSVTSITLTMIFDSSLEGETWQVSGNGEVYSGVVSSSLEATCTLYHSYSTYTVTCGSITRDITTQGSGSLTVRLGVSAEFLNGVRIGDFGTGTYDLTGLEVNSGRVIFTVMWDNQVYDPLRMNGVDQATQTTPSSVDQKLVWCTAVETPTVDHEVIEFPSGDGGAEGRFIFAADSDTNNITVYSDGETDSTRFEITTSDYHSELWLVFWCSSQSTITQYTLNGETVAITQDYGERWNGYKNTCYAQKISNVASGTTYVLETPSSSNGVLFAAGV